MNDYGKTNKRIVFTDWDHRHAQLILRLKHDKMKQAEFFRHMVTAYITGDERIQSYVDEVKQQNTGRTQKSKRLVKQGKELVNDLGLNEGEINNIFDRLAEEYPEL